MQDIQLYQQILGATDPWHVESVRLDQAKQAIEIKMALKGFFANSSGQNLGIRAVSGA